MDNIDNNQFEIKPTAKAKRKIAAPSANVYLNPALDLLANEDPMCNTGMEIVPKKRKRTKSCDITTFENTALDLGISKAAVNEFLARELNNVKRNARNYDSSPKASIDEPIYANTTVLNIPQNLHSIDETLLNQQSSFDDIAVNAHQNSQNNYNGILAPVPEVAHQFDNETLDISEIRADDDVLDSGISEIDHNTLNAAGVNEISKDFSATNITNIQTNVTNQIFVNNASNMSLSFIDRLALDSPSTSNQSIYFDDDLNESNIMEIKTITIITKKKKNPEKVNTNPFLNPNIDDDIVIEAENPFLDPNETKTEPEYNPEANLVQNDIQTNTLMPRRLFASDTNSTISTVNESVADNHEYENIDGYRSESPIYENSDEILNKQSKLLGCDVSQFSAIDIMNLNKNSQANSSNESTDSKKDFKHQILKAGNKLSKKVYKTLKRTFKSDKSDPNVTLNPYEVPRKPPKGKTKGKEAGFENPALNLDISDDIEIEEIDGVEHTYETVKTLRNTRLNMNVTPLRERNCEAELSHNRTNTPGKKVRFDATLNQEKIITGDSFDDIQSPGFDAKIDKYHDELENCINERKFIQQNM
ncbi:uncharacterized protein [Choristoneura fumiferana]|uniref:uncharacterized protein n=1 Tax=Choristoneura fumiferana TaxID=7141 RepID=UPI003D15AE4B